MKKMFLIILAAVLVIVTVACQAAPKKDPFSPFEESFTATLALEINGNQSVFDIEWNVEVPMLTMTLLEPEIASGYVFNGINGTYSLSYGDVSLNCEAALSEIPQMAEAAFSPSKDGIVSIGTVSVDGQTFTEVKTADVSYIFASDGTPMSLNGVICGRSVSMKIEDISVK